MRLLLLRHGQSGGNLGLKGKDEFDNLTLRGVKQAEEAGEKLKNRKIATIYCSTAKRCEQTLDEILKMHEAMVPIHISRLIRPKMKKESWGEVQRRVKLFLADLECEAEETDTLMVISHLPIIKMFAYEIEGKTGFWENGEVMEFEIKKLI